MKSFLIGGLAFLTTIVLVAQAEQARKVKNAVLQSRLESASKKPVLSYVAAPLMEMGMIYPSGSYGAGNGLKEPEGWPEPVLLAAFLNTECRSCSFREKKLVLEALRNRAEQNYDGFGNSIFKQIFARRYDKKHGKWRVQFSGVGKPDKLKELFFYRRRDKHSTDNYKAVHQVFVEGERTLPCNVTDFIHPPSAVIEKEIQRQAKNRYAPYAGFYKDMKHRFAYSPKIKCSAP